MAIIQGLLPPSRENWELICTIWKWFPIITTGQWVTSYYPMGKTSIESRFNIPGKWGWLTMEAPGFMILLYIMFTLPKELGLNGLPPTNWAMAGMFTLHYIYRAVLSPLFLNPSMSPIHPLVWILAFGFQVFNAISLGGWLAGHGPTTLYDWAGRLYTIEIGMVIWGWFLLLNIYHDDDLREIRRAAGRRQRREAEQKAKDEGRKVEDVLASSDVSKIYMVPKNGLFHFVLYAHFLCEWVEWFGFWMVGGWDCVPARTFLVNEIFSMMPRALRGWHWYVEKFGREKIGNRKAIIPGLL